MNWHYSKRMPSGKLVHIGVWENNAFIGAVMFGVGANRDLVKPYGLIPEQGCELVRVALKAHKSPVSRILSIALRLLAAHCPNLKIVVSFADPEQGHHGGIYQATNWLYAGTSLPSDEYLVNGKRWQGRAIRHKKPEHLTIREYVKTLDPSAEVIKGSAKHRYLYPLDDAMRTQIQPLSKPYPKRVGSIDSDALGFQPREGSARLTPPPQK